MARDPKKLSAEDQAIWSLFVRNITPLEKSQRRKSGGVKGFQRLEGKSREKPDSVMHDVRPAVMPRSSTALDLSRPVSIDRSSWKKLKTGRLPIEGTLDLHGMTLERAHRKLDQFITQSFSRGARCLLIITGKSQKDAHSPTLRKMVPMWLESGDVASKVISFTPAQPKHGGDGALYVLIRRQKRPRI